MNKLYNALIIIQHLGLKKSLGKDAEEIFDILFEESKSLKDEDLNVQDLEIVKIVDKLLDDKMKLNKTNKNYN